MEILDDEAIGKRRNSNNVGRPLETSNGTGR